MAETDIRTAEVPPESDYCKFWLEGAQTLEEAAQRLEAEAERLRKLADEGWELSGPVSDGWLHFENLEKGVTVFGG